MHTLVDITGTLTRTPQTLRALLAGAPTQLTHANYGPGTWSATQVVGHLIAAEQDDWLPRLHRILRHGESLPFDPFDHTATLTVDPSADALNQLLDRFEHLRMHNLRSLHALSLSPTDLDRTGTHPALGRVTVMQLLSTWAAHDLHHLRQVALAMAWQFREAVGPWRAYLNTFARDQR